jgi:hypothetical protein
MSFENSPVQAWYEAAPSDRVRMRELLHPQVEFKFCAGWPNGGTFSGPDAVMDDFFPASAKAWERLKAEVDEVIDGGDTYVVRGHLEGVASGTHLPFTAEFVHIWRVKDGRLLSLKQLADTAVLADAVAGRRPGTPVGSITGAE